MVSCHKRGGKEIVTVRVLARETARMQDPLPSSPNNFVWKLVPQSEHVYLIEVGDKAMVTVGIDVSKAKLDVWSPVGHQVISNKESAIRQCFEAMEREARIVMEAMGKYHRLAHKVLEEMGFKVMIVDPFQVHHFAKATRVLSKTDRGDAEVLALFGEKMGFTATPMASAEAEEFQALVRCSDRLKEMKAMLKVQLSSAEEGCEAHLWAVLKSVEVQLEEIEARLLLTVESSPQLRERFEIMCSMPGVGVTTALRLLGLLPELGEATRGGIAKLSGLAPALCESGVYKGKSRIRGGRREVRRALYLPMVSVCTLKGSPFYRHYKQLIDAGKSPKAAIVACMRRLICALNSMLRKGEMWRPV